MDLKEMMVLVVYESPDGLAPLEIVEAVTRRFEAQTNARQVLQTVSANPKLFVEAEGRIKKSSGSPSEPNDSRMDLKQMIVSVVYESPEGLVPLDVVDAVTRRFGAHSNTSQIMQTVRSNPKLFAESGGRVRKPSDSPPELSDSNMDLKQMIVTAVYESPEGLVPLDLVEAVTRRFGAKPTTRQVLQVVSANPKLFLESEGRIKKPSGSPPEPADSRMDLKDMMIAVVYDNPDGLVPLEIVEAITRRFGAPINTRQVLQTIKANPKLFVESEGRVRTPSNHS